MRLQSLQVEALWSLIAVSKCDLSPYGLENFVGQGPTSHCPGEALGRLTLIAILHLPLLSPLITSLPTDWLGALHHPGLIFSPQPSEMICFHIPSSGLADWVNHWCQQLIMNYLQL